MDNNINLLSCAASQNHKRSNYNLTILSSVNLKFKTCNKTLIMNNIHKLIRSLVY